jgi:hypothetical protein
MFFVAPVTVALVLGLVVNALPASGSSTSLISRVAKLEAQTKALKAANTALSKRVKKLEGLTGCMDQLAPIASYGIPSGGEGYLYTQDRGTTIGLTTALDVVPTGQTPPFIAVGVDPQCVSQTRALTAHVRGLSKAARVLSRQALSKR